MAVFFTREKHLSTMLVALASCASAAHCEPGYIMPIDNPPVIHPYTIQQSIRSQDGEQTASLRATMMDETSLALRVTLPDGTELSAMLPFEPSDDLALEEMTLQSTAESNFGAIGNDIPLYIDIPYGEPDPSCFTNDDGRDRIRVELYDLKFEARLRLIENCQITIENLPLQE